ncbi:inducible metalloproteinase inhibitor protein-like [Centruroides vittatus]|uniref:inducible metalloproteinase inhibitor protein-like n=1 Tax=Centruroides vittatus TaxID=120091 RepID=UPI00350F0940
MLPVVIVLFFLYGSLGIARECFVNEQFSKCQAHCQSYCNWTNGTIVTPPCPKICVNGCVCQDNYVRLLPEGKSFCIPKTQCKKCPEHEHFDQCSAQCQNTCKSEDGKPLICPLICASGCICDDGYARKDGTPKSPCVRIQDCPKLKTSTISSEKVK